MVGCHIHGGSIAIAGKPARQAFAGVPVGFVDGIAFRLDLHFSVRGRRLVRSSRAAARHVAVFVNRDLYIRVVSCPGTQGNRDGPAFHCDRDHTWRLSLAAALGIYLCDVAPASDSGRDCIRSGKAIVRVVCASAHLRGFGLTTNCTHLAHTVDITPKGGTAWGPPNPIATRSHHTFAARIEKGEVPNRVDSTACAE